MTTWHPAAWSSYLPWVEYTHNSLVSVATDVSPFIALLGYQPPLFKHQEEQIAVSAVHVNLRRCRNIWHQVNAALLRSSLQAQKQANHSRTPAPVYCQGQRV